MQLIQTHVKASGSKVVKSAEVKWLPDHIIDLRMVTDESIWIETPAGLLRISTIDFQGRTMIEILGGDAKTVKVHRT